MRKEILSKHFPLWVNNFYVNEIIQFNASNLLEIFRVTEALQLTAEATEISIYFH